MSGLCTTALLVVACPDLIRTGSKPTQLSGIVDDTIEKAPKLICGLATRRQAGYLLVKSICSRSQRHKEIRSFPNLLWRVKR